MDSENNEAKGADQHRPAGQRRVLPPCSLLVAVGCYSVAPRSSRQRDSGCVSSTGRG